MPHDLNLNPTLNGETSTDRFCDVAQKILEYVVREKKRCYLLSNIEPKAIFQHEAEAIIHN